MIAAYAHHGCGGEAISLFKEMLNLGIKPNDVTYVGLLAACSHAGLVDEGLKYFDELIKDKSIQVQEDHYSCLVDLCGRAGRVKEAFDFIQRHPIEPSGSVWGAFLTGCYVHRNTNMGKLAAKRLFELEPENADPNLFNPLRQSIINSIFDPSWRRFGNLRGIQVIARVNVTTTTELLSEQALSYDQMVSTFAVADEVVIMEDVGGSVQRRGMGVSKAAIDGLKKVLVFNDEKCTRTCLVCLEEFGEGTEVTSMPCCHLFHHGCIVPWLKSHNSCPMCRYQVRDS
ncbi:hypothetical protein TEA_006681 [Camellia sinensis var. sinensis]|uniref:RING-type domain-containing protein n=1 Tax=Camellia sinensis var. sinensis TaxID=542762 RepID=A0A4S4DWW9_CAMSN|nr:hypothetical protein TEA_006681 [Camellia sinensis var. sinensis]